MFAYMASLRTIEAKLCLGVREAFCERPFLVVRLGVLLGPLASSLYGGVLVFFPPLSNVVRQRVVGVWRSEQCLDGEEDGADLQSRGPVALRCQ